jgi:PAS domain S-box-containing protein
MNEPGEREASPSPDVVSEMSIPVEDRYRLLVTHIEDYAIFMLDQNGCVSSWNIGAQNIKGYTSDEVIGKHFSIFYTPPDLERGAPYRALAVAKQKGKIVQEGWRVRKDGSLFWANVILTALYDDKHNLIGFAKITRDMTERKRLEELEASGQRINEFLAMLAHELRNPLAPIRNAVSILQIESGLPISAKNCRDIIDRQLTHMTRLVDDLLDIGRISTGKIVLHCKPIDIREAVLRSVESSRHFFNNKNQQFDVNIPDHDIIVNGDLTRLVQVIQNLLHNASKFTANGGFIMLTVHDEERSVAIKIADNGRGLTEKAIGEIFNLFVQDDAQLNPTESGLGIGLTLCRSLVEMHGGAISAESAGKGTGSTFTVRLPKHSVQITDSYYDSNGRTTDHPIYKIMVVDDNHDSADSMAMFLTMMGHETRSVYNGKNAIALAKTFKPDIVLLDLAMPGLDGFQVRECLKEMPELAHTIISAMTGFGGDDARARSISTGFDEHLVKPVTPAAIKRVLDLAEDNDNA